MRRIFLALSFFLLWGIRYPFSFLYAQWPTTPDSALHVSFGIYPMLVVDPRDESITVIYLVADKILAKKFDRYGESLWGGNEITLSDTAWGFLISEYAWPTGQWGQVVSDDSGGAIICWEDFRNAEFIWIMGEPIPQGSEIYIQRVDANGQIRYGTHGKKISGPAAEGFHKLGDMKTDNHGGFVVAYSGDSTNTVSAVKRFNKNGTAIWEQYIEGRYIDLNAADEAGNIFVSTIITSLPGKRHKLDLNGNMLWPDTLIGIIPDDIGYRGGGAFSDGMEGVIGVGPGGYLRINRANSTGQFVFGEEGIDLGEGPFAYIRYASDKLGGIYLNWTNQAVKVQRISKDGNIVFDSSDVKICDGSHCQGTRGIITDGQHGAIIIWGDTRNSPLKSFYAQKIDSSGNILWDSTGIEFHTSFNDLFLTGSAIPLHPDGSGGAILIWNEGPSLAISMKQISRNGILGEKDSTVIILSNTPAISLDKPFLEQNYPNPFNLLTTIKFSILRSDIVILKIFNLLGQEVKTLLRKHLSAGNYEVVWNGRDEFNHEVSSGIYIYRLTTGDHHLTRKMLLIK